MDQQHSIEKVAALLKGARMGALTTISEDGTLQSRPMAIQQVEFDGDLWFFTYEDSSKIKQITADPHVNVAVQNGNDWVSLSGIASVVHDKAKAKELWAKPLQAWFPDGLETDGLTLIKVNAETAEYWDSNMNKLTYAFKLATAIATNSQPDAGENETVRLDEK